MVTHPIEYRGVLISGGRSSSVAGGIEEECLNGCCNQEKVRVDDLVTMATKDSITENAKTIHIANKLICYHVQ